jgi:hypothetical protein
MMSRAVVPGSGVQPDLVDSHVSVAAKLVTKPWLLATGGVGAVLSPNSCRLVAWYPSPGSAPGMRSLFGVEASMRNTWTGLPLASRLVSLPVNPSKGWPVGDTLPLSA